MRIKLYLLMSIVVTSIFITGCTNTENNLTPESLSVQKDQLHMLEPEKVDEILKRNDIGIIDTRTKKEFEKGTLDDRAILIEIRKRPQLEESLFWFEKKIKKLDKNKTWLLYCDSGNKSILGGELMIKNGFKNIYEVQGGLNAYETKMSKNIEIKTK